MTLTACMDERESALWTEANARIPTVSKRAQSPCADCPLAFHLEMLAQGCCDGAPTRGRPVRHLADPKADLRRTQWRETARRYRAKRASIEVAGAVGSAVASESTPRKRAADRGLIPPVPPAA